MARFIKNQSSFEFQGDAGGPEGKQPVVTFKITEENFDANVRDALAMLHNCNLHHKCLDVDMLDGLHASEIIAASTTFPVKLNVETDISQFKVLMPIAINVAARVKPADADDNALDTWAVVKSIDLANRVLTCQSEGLITGTLAEWADVGLPSGPTIGQNFWTANSANGWTSTEPVSGFAQSIGGGWPTDPASPLQLQMLLMIEGPRVVDPFGLTLVEISDNYTASMGEMVVMTAGSGKTLTLPNITAGDVGRPIALKIVNKSGSPWSIDGDGSDTVEGDTIAQISHGSRWDMAPISTTEWTI